MEPLEEEPAWYQGGARLDECFRDLGTHAAPFNPRLRLGLEPQGSVAVQTWPMIRCVPVVLGAHWAEERSRHGGIDEIPLPEPLPGRLFLCGKQFICPDPEAAMAHVGASLVVCLNERAELDRYPNYLDWMRAQSRQRFLWWPIPDLGAPDHEAFLRLLAELAKRLVDGERLIVHCGGGIGRAGTVAVAMLVAFGVEPGDAIDHVREHRPMAGPEAGAQSELLRWLTERRSGPLGWVGPFS